MRRKAILSLVPLSIFIMTAASCGGCFFWPGGGIPSETREILDQADELELYSLFPVEGEKGLPERFQGWPVLGKTRVRDAETRRRLLEALAGATRRYHQWLPGAACFFPRHGIHASYRGKSVDLAICFQCGYVYQNDMEVVFHTTDTPQPVFDAVLVNAGIPLAPSGPPPWKLPNIHNDEERLEESNHSEL